MRVPRLNMCGVTSVLGGVKTKVPPEAPINLPLGLEKDTVQFSSTAGYLKKYRTLPDEIKKELTPEDAIDMFKDMERIASGANIRKNIGRGAHATVYKTPWLKDYYLLVLNDTNYDKHTIYSQTSLGSSVWCDKDDPRIQIIGKSA